MSSFKHLGCAALASYAMARALAAEGLEAPSAADAALDVDDECAGAAGEEQEQCSLSALQRRGLRKAAAVAEAEQSGVASGAGDAAHGQWPMMPPPPPPPPAGSAADTMWPWGGHHSGSSSHSSWPWQSWSPPWSGPSAWDPSSWMHPPAPVPGPGGPIHAPSPVPTPSDQCAALTDPANSGCKDAVDWIANQGGKYDPKAAEWFVDIKTVTGVELMNATVDDFQRMYFCSPPGGNACGAPPCSCSKPPCQTCFGGAPPKKPRPECEHGETTIACVPPKRPMEYRGMAWPTMTYSGRGEMHIFAIGDWGGMDGSLNPIEGRTKLMAYSWGARPGPSVFPRTRWNKYHTIELCNHDQFTKCYDTHGQECPRSCGYMPEIDEQPQQLVAKAMTERAEMNRPQYILNVGDNFYWGGIEKTCGTPMDQISFTAHHQFDQVFEKVYTAGSLNNAPWLSVLGNHDWGGRQFNNGWDQQIAYTWASNRWIMPAPYYSAHVEYPDQLFSADIFMVDTNFLDAKYPSQDSEHNICGEAHNPPGADCSAADGPSSVATCKRYFDDLWAEQRLWLSRKVQESTATWQIMVTHFPCGEDGQHGGFYRQLRHKGLDFLVTGHRHDQELWKGSSPSNFMGGLTCIVTGGGGGISSEATPDPSNTGDWFGEAQYGFFDITITKQRLLVESINWDGTVAKSTEVYPK